MLVLPYVLALVCALPLKVVDLDAETNTEVGMLYTISSIVYVLLIASTTLAQISGNLAVSSIKTSR